MPKPDDDRPQPEPPPVRPPTLPPDFLDIPQNPGSELQPPPDPSPAFLLPAPARRVIRQGALSAQRGSSVSPLGRYRARSFFPDLGRRLVLVGGRRNRNNAARVVFRARRALIFPPIEGRTLAPRWMASGAGLTRPDDRRQGTAGSGGDGQDQGRSPPSSRRRQGRSYTRAHRALGREPIHLRVHGDGTEGGFRAALFCVERRNK
jgi:hypothetical protein